MTIQFRCYAMLWFALLATIGIGCSTVGQADPSPSIDLINKQTGLSLEKESEVVHYDNARGEAHCFVIRVTEWPKNLGPVDSLVPAGPHLECISSYTKTRFDAVDNTGKVYKFPHATFGNITVIALDSSLGKLLVFNYPSE